MVRRPKEEEWVRADSADALKIFEESIARCAAGEGVYRCRPPARPIN